MRTGGWFHSPAPYRQRGHPSRSHFDSGSSGIRNAVSTPRTRPPVEALPERHQFSNGQTMKLTQLKFLILVVLTAMMSLTASKMAQAYDACLTPAESRQSYRNCMAFLQLSPAEQQAAVRGTGSSWEEGVRACQMQKRKGLAGMLKAEREYCRATTETVNVPAQRNPHACSSSRQCVGWQHCVNWNCVDKSRQACTNAHSCAPGESCISGECR